VRERERDHSNKIKFTPTTAKPIAHFADTQPKNRIRMKRKKKKKKKKIEKENDAIIN